MHFTIKIDFNSVVVTDGIDGFNDLICSLTHPDLQDISWTVVKSDGCMLTLKVEGCIEDDEEGDK